MWDRKQRARTSTRLCGEVKIIDIDEKDFPPDKPEEEPAKPDTPPVLKPAPPKKP